MSKRTIHKYSETKLVEAMASIRVGMKIREACRTYGIPRGTLQDRIHGRVPEGPRKMGPETVLTNDEEKAIVEWCANLAKCGFPLKVDDLLNTVKNIVSDDGRNTPFKNGRPGKKWYQLFLKRNPTLTHRTPEGISKGRAVVTEEFIKNWFANLKTYLNQIGAEDILDDPTRIFNGDETSFILCPNTGKVIAPRGYKNVYQIQKGKEKEAITVLLFFSASGEILHPCVVFPYVRTPKDVVNSVPDKWLIGRSDTGWMRSEIFLDYISKGLHDWLKENSIKMPVLVFVDGHKSHLTMDLSKYCADNGIILYALPPNTTHLMQPADVSVFKPLKSDWKHTVRHWQTQPENINKMLTKSTFCPLLEKVLCNKNLKESIKNGFRKCGLYPYNPNSVDYTKCVQNTLETLNRLHSLDLQLNDLESAEKTITFLKDNLHSSGVDVAIVMHEIEKLKNCLLMPNTDEHIYTQNTDQTHNKTELPLVRDNLTILQADTTVLQNTRNEETVLNLSLPIINDSVIFGYSADSMDNRTVNNLNIDEWNFNVSENGILLPITNSDKAIDRNKNNEKIHIISNILIKPAQISPVLTKHLKIPSPIKKGQQRNKSINRIGAISSKEWQQFEKKKEEDKERKTSEILKRKQERLQRKQEKEEAKAMKKRNMRQRNIKRKKLNRDPDLPSTITKIKCIDCQVDLVSDTEENDLKNIGCDTCLSWYHLKCTKFAGSLYEDIVNEHFVCNKCNI